MSEELDNVEELDDELEFERDEFGNDIEYDSDEEDEAYSEEDATNAYDSIMKEMAVAIASSIPPASVVVAVAEVANAAWDLYHADDNSPTASQAKFQMLMGIICMVPGIGGGFRLAFKSLIRKPQFYGPVMFDVVVSILEHANRIFDLKLPLNPEKYLLQMIDVSTLQQYLDEARVKSVAELNEYSLARWSGMPEHLDSFLKMISGQLTMIIEDVLAPTVRIAIERCLLRRVNSARSSNVHGNSTNNGSNSTHGNGSTPTVTRGRGSLTARIKSQFESINMNFVIGGVGEHIADYYCLERLGWGKVKTDCHDQAKRDVWIDDPDSSNLGKLNDRKILNKNAAIGNETGIDGFWRANLANNHGKKYAIIEAKATAGVARETDSFIARKLGKLNRTHNGKTVVQMDHYWIEKRIGNELQKLPNTVQVDIKTAIFKRGLKQLYTRHIIVVSLMIDPGLSHIEALLDNKPDTAHALHNGLVIHVHGEPRIKRIIQTKLQQLASGSNKNRNGTKP